ncbi:MAG: response regulator, partial [Caulobacteraceae bacterium]|nr:response regulator [Caulobacteraceae bacterium]
MCHVLVIEDDPIAALDIHSVLKGAGATSFSFADTQAEAVERARESLPSVIVSDVMLSKGTGPAAIREIRAAFGRLPVIFVTAVPDMCEEPDVEILEKPFSTDQLAALFRQLRPN